MDSYDIHEMIGRGAFATCQLVRRKADGRLLVLKTMSHSIGEMTEDEKLDFVNEVKVLADLNHPNIIQYVGSFVSDNTQHIVMEYAAGGSLAKMIKETKIFFHENQIWEWFAQMCVALKYVHSQNILHRDIKPQNILLWGREQRVIKLADFGIAKVLNSNHTLAATLVGTPYYLSPELCEGRKYDSKSDIWALGCVLYELVALKKPFASPNIPALVLSITRGRLEELPSESQKYSKPLLDLLGTMLDVDCNRRPAIEDIIRIPIVAHKVQLWRAIQDSVIAVEAASAQEDADNYILQRTILPDVPAEEASAEEDGAYSGTSRSSRSSKSSSSPRVKKLRGKASSGGRSSNYSSLERVMAFNSPLGSGSSSGSGGSSGVYCTGRRNNKQIRRVPSGRSTGGLSQGRNSVTSSRNSSGLRSISGNSYSALSLSSMSEYDARVIFSRYLAEVSRVYRWGSGQRRPILDDKLIGLNIDRVVQPRFLEDTEEHSHILAIGVDGDAFAWGSSSDGCLGLGKRNTTERAPKLIQYFHDREIRISDIDCGNSHSACISSDGKVYIWGDLGNAGGFEGLQLKREMERLQDLNAFATAASTEFDAIYASGSPMSYKSRVSNRFDRDNNSEDVESWPAWAQREKQASDLSEASAVPSPRNPFSTPSASPRPSDEFSRASSDNFVEENYTNLDQWPEWAKKEARISGLSQFSPRRSGSSVGSVPTDNPFASPRSSLLSGSNPFAIPPPLSAEGDDFQPDKEEWPEWARRKSEIGANPFTVSTGERCNPFAIAFADDNGVENSTGNKRTESIWTNTTMEDEAQILEEASPPTPKEAVATEEDEEEKLTESASLPPKSPKSPTARLQKAFKKDLRNVKTFVKGLADSGRKWSVSSSGSASPRSPTSPFSPRRLFGYNGKDDELKQQESEVEEKEDEAQPKRTKKRATSLTAGRPKLNLSLSARPNSTRSVASDSSATPPRKHFLGVAVPNKINQSVNKVMGWVGRSPPQGPSEEGLGDFDAHFQQNTSQQLLVGARVHLLPKKEQDCAVIKFIGMTDFAPGIWVGLELDKPKGKNNGTVKGTEYFCTGEKYGLFVRPQSVRVVVPGEKFSFNKEPPSKLFSLKSPRKLSSPRVSVRSSFASVLDDINEDEAELKEDEGEAAHSRSEPGSAGESLSDPKDASLQTYGSSEYIYGVEDDPNIGDVIYEPRLVYALKNVFAIQVCCGGAFTGVITRDGTVFTWGENDYGQLGVGDDDSRGEPTQVLFPDNQIVKTVCCGDEHMMAISGDGTTVFAWGRGDSGQLGLGVEVFDESQCTPAPVVDIMAKAVVISAGKAHSACITEQGEAYTWGCGSDGQLGHGDFENKIAPTEVETLGRNGADVQVVDVSCGAAHTMILTENRNVYSFGNDQRNGSERNPISAIPRAIECLVGASIQTLCSGSYSTFAISKVDNPQDGL